MASFESTVARIEAGIARDHGDPSIDPRCTAILRHHGRMAAQAVVLFHGFTNCPRQFEEFAERAYARGWNVLVPRLPHHGLRDKLTLDMAALTLDELIQCTEESAADAAALGSEVCALGLSVGGTMALWLAQTQAVARAIAVAPFISIDHLPGSLEPLFAAALGLAPNLEMWWNPKLREAQPPTHGYPRFPTHALAQCLRLGERVRARARDAAPRAASTLLVTNELDPAIDNGAARDIIARWRKHTSAVDEFVFTTLDARHDIIEPTTYPEARTLVYPKLLDFLAP